MDDKKPGFFGLSRGDRSTHLRPLDTDRRKGLVGRVESYRERRAIDRATQEQEASERLFAAATRLAHTQREYTRVMGLMTPDHFRMIEVEEQLKAEEQFMVIEMSHAVAVRKKKAFDREASRIEEQEEIKDLLLVEELHLVRERVRKLKGEAFGSADAKVVEEPSVEERRKELNAKLDALHGERLEVDLEFAELVKTGVMDEATNAELSRRRNKIQEAIERLEDELGAI